MGERAKILTVALVVALGLGACKIDLDKAPCPCVAGWECCAATKTCVRPDDPCVRPYKDQDVPDGPLADMILPDMKPDAAVPDMALPDQKVVVPPWVSLFGDPAGGWVRGFGLDVDKQGNTYVTGFFSGTVAFGSTTLKAPILLPTGKEQLFVVKLDPAGKVLWAVSPPKGTIMKATGYSVVADASGNAYVAGSFTGQGTFGTTSFDTKGTDYFVTKLDSAGKVLWATCGGGKALDAVKSMKLDTSGNLYLAGRFEQTTNIGGVTLTAKGKSALFVAKMDPTGKVLWAVSSGGAASTSSSALTWHPVGKKVFICGSLTGKAVFGSITLDSGTQKASLVARLDHTGKFLWAVRGAGAYNRCSGVTTRDITGGVYINGSYISGSVLGGTTLGKGSSGMYVARLDNTGKFDWVTDLGKANGWHGIAVKGNGEVIATGSLNTTSTGGDALVARLSPKGKVLGTITAKSSGALSDYCVDVGLDGAGNVYSMGTVFYDSFLGTNTGTATFDKLTFNLKGRGHLFVWKMPAF